MPYYAQINENGIVYAITETSKEVIAADMIPVNGLDESLLGNVYVGTGVFEPPPTEIQN